MINPKWWLARHSKEVVVGGRAEVDTLNCLVGALINLMANIISCNSNKYTLVARFLVWLGEFYSCYSVIVQQKLSGTTLIEYPPSNVHVDARFGCNKEVEIEPLISSVEVEWVGAMVQYMSPRILYSQVEIDLYNVSPNWDNQIVIAQLARVELTSLNLIEGKMKAQIIANCSIYSILQWKF